MGVEGEGEGDAGVEVVSGEGVYRYIYILLDKNGEYISMLRILLTKYISTSRS